MAKTFMRRRTRLDDSEDESEDDVDAITVSDIEYFLGTC